VHRLQSMPPPHTHTHTAPRPLRTPIPNDHYENRYQCQHTSLTFQKAVCMWEGGTQCVIFLLDRAASCHPLLSPLLHPHCHHTAVFATAAAAAAPGTQVRRKADGAKDLVKEFVGKWQDNEAVVGDVTHTEMKGRWRQQQLRLGKC
jgi:hypothetical protein